MGRPTRRIAGILAIRHDLPLGFYYLYVPRPGALAADFFREVVKLAQETGALFLKIDPPRSPPESLVTRHPSFVIRPSHSLQPRETIRIDCTKLEDELLAAMHPKTRYNVRLAERQGVEVRPVPSLEREAGAAGFARLLVETAGREKFSPHPTAHYVALLEVRSAAFENELWVAEWQGALLAAAMVNWYRPASAATYLHGASLREHREKMAPHLLHWRIIQAARERTFAGYDLGGIDAARWPGVTRFKKGFGGRVLQFPPSCDIVFRPWFHRLYRLQHWLRHGTTP